MSTTPPPPPPPPPAPPGPLTQPQPTNQPAVPEVEPVASLAPQLPPKPLPEAAARSRKASQDLRDAFVEGGRMVEGGKKEIEMSTLNRGWASPVASEEAQKTNKRLRRSLAKSQNKTTCSRTNCCLAFLGVLSFFLFIVALAMLVGFVMVLDKGGAASCVVIKPGGSIHLVTKLGLDDEKDFVKVRILFFLSLSLSLSLSVGVLLFEIVKLCYQRLFC
jgi:hypothetical protein